jgi:hypothetical protein
MAIIIKPCAVPLAAVVELHGKTAAAVALPFYSRSAAEFIGEGGRGGSRYGGCCYYYSVSGSAPAIGFHSLFSTGRERNKENGGDQDCAFHKLLF